MIYRNTPERQAIADVLRGLLATRKLRKVCEDLTQTGMELGTVVQAKLQHETETRAIYCKAYSVWHGNVLILFDRWLEQSTQKTWPRLNHPVNGSTWHGQESEGRWQFIEYLLKVYTATPANVLVDILKTLKPRQEEFHGRWGLMQVIAALIIDIEVFRLWRDTRDNSIQSWLTGPGAGTIGLDNAQASEDWSDLNTDRWSMVEHLIEYYSTPTQGASS